MIKVKDCVACCYCILTIGYAFRLRFHRATNDWQRQTQPLNKPTPPLSCKSRYWHDFKSPGDSHIKEKKRKQNCACGEEVDTQVRMMADTGSDEVAVIGNIDLTPGEIENNMKNTVNFADTPLIKAMTCKSVTCILTSSPILLGFLHCQAIVSLVPGVA